jgi:hypothetical protein
MEDFRAAVMDRASKKISKSVLNFEGTLKLRINNIDSASSSYHKKSMEQQNNYISLQEKLMFSMGSLIDDDGGVHVAISFDEHGAVKEAAIL